MIEEEDGDVLIKNEEIGYNIIANDEDTILKKSNDLTTDEECCSICLDTFTNYGDHRLSCLACGHLFGFNCIDTWLHQGNDKCPQCNAKSKPKEIRLLYARNIKVIDTVERDRALEVAEAEKELRHKMEMRLMECKVLLDMTQKECQLLRSQVMQYQKQIDNFNQSTSSSSLTLTQQKNQRAYHLELTIEMSKENSARLMAYNPNFSLLVVSQSNTSPLVSRFGIKKVNTLDFKVGEYVGLHSKVIRDLAFSYGSPSAEPLLLSVSLDKGVHITSMKSNAIIQKYTCDVPAWSCCWDSDNNNQFYAGLSNGVILLFDIRNTNRPVEQITYCQSQSKSPIVSVQYVPYEPTSDFSHGGLLVGQLDKSYFLRLNPDKTRDHHLLSLEGNLFDLKFEPSTRHFLASFRPSLKHRRTRFQLCSLTTEKHECSQPIEDTTSQDASMNPPPLTTSTNTDYDVRQRSSTLNGETGNDNKFDCDIIQTFKGGMAQALLTKSHIFVNRETEGDNAVLTNPGLLQICAGDEETKQLLIWDVATGSLQHRLRTMSPILDILSITNMNPHLLLTLSASHLQVFKWKPL